MRVYIPFADGSSISYDGAKFTLRAPPVEIDADLSARADGLAERAWKERRSGIVRALVAAWWRQKELRRKEATKRIYGKTPATPPDRR